MGKSPDIFIYGQDSAGCGSPGDPRSSGRGLSVHKSKRRSLDALGRQDNQHECLSMEGLRRGKRKAGRLRHGAWGCSIGPADIQSFSCAFFKYSLSVYKEKHIYICSYKIFSFYNVS